MNQRLARLGGAHRIAAGLVAAMALYACQESSHPNPPVPTAMAPDHGMDSAVTPVVIEGRDFHARVQTDFQDKSSSELAARWTARLGSYALRDVTLRADGKLDATVPEGMVTGSYDLTVVDPWGREGKLPQAYRVISSISPSALVAGYRFETIADQVASSPFIVGIDAVDARGDVVTGFAGTVSLSDKSGS